MGENIGDLGGILLGLDAYKLSLNGKPAPVIDGFTGEQRVFLGWAQVWRTLMRDDALRQHLDDRPALARHGPRLRAAAQHRRLVRGVRREGRRHELHQAGGARPHLVADFGSRAARKSDAGGFSPAFFFSPRQWLAAYELHTKPLACFDLSAGGRKLPLLDNLQKKLAYELVL